MSDPDLVIVESDPTGAEHPKMILKFKGPDGREYWAAAISSAIYSDDGDHLPVTALNQPGWRVIALTLVTR